MRAASNISVYDLIRWKLRCSNGRTVGRAWSIGEHSTAEKTIKDGRCYRFYGGTNLRSGIYLREFT